MLQISGSCFKNIYVANSFTVWVNNAINWMFLFNLKILVTVNAKYYSLLKIVLLIKHTTFTACIIRCLQNFHYELNYDTSCSTFYSFYYLLCTHIRQVKTCRISLFFCMLTWNKFNFHNIYLEKLILIFYSWWKFRSTFWEIEFPISIQLYSK